MNSRVLFLTRGPRIMGSSRYRFFQYLPYLQNRNFDCDVVPFFSDEDTARIAAGRPPSVPT